MLPANTLSAGMRCWLLPAILKARLGVPWVIHSVGLGNLSSSVEGGLAHSFNAADYASVRDEHSAAHLKNLGCRCNVDADLAFALPDLMNANEWHKLAQSVLPPGFQVGAYLVVQASLGYVQYRFQQWCDAILEIAAMTQLPILLLPICHQLSDRATLKMAFSNLNLPGLKVAKVSRWLRTTETAAIIGGSAGYCGTSLHGAVTAVSFAVPASVLCRAIPGKHDGVLGVVGHTGCVVAQPEDLPSAHARANRINRGDIAARGMALAKAGFDHVAAALLCERTASRTIDPILIDAIQADLDTFTKGPYATFKRAFFRSVRVSPRTTEVYELAAGLLRGRFK